MWILKRDVQGSQNEDSFYLTVGEHLVGRKDCQIQVTGDQSVSRKHAWITVSQSCNDKAQVTLKDVSKFGCLVNDVKCQNSVVVVLKHDDKITFGTQNSSYSLKYEPLVLFASCLDSAKKKTLKSQLGKLGGYMVNEWQKECSHLVMEALSFTVKVIYALVTCCPIVTPLYFDNLLEAIESKAAELPSLEKYMPPIKEDLIDQLKVSFHPNEARKTVFAGKLFLFLEKKQHKRLQHAVALAGGKTLLKEIGDMSGSDDDLLTDESTLVMSANLSMGITEEKEKWIGHVGDVLKSLDRRPIAETEIGLAILHVSLDEYCNSSLNHVPKITKQIVSKSISTMEEMSQRINESPNISLHQVPEKKPFSLTSIGQKPDPIVTTSQDSRKRSRNGSDESQTVIFETPDSRSVESKRRKLSATDITHVSQTPLSLFKTPGVPQGSSPAQKLTSPTDKQSHKPPKESPSVCKADTSQESRIVCQKRKSSSPDNITHISQSQVSPNEGEQRDSSSQRGKKLRLTRSKADATHISQSQFPPIEEESSNVSRDPHEITHISQSQFSQKDVKPTATVSTCIPRPESSISEDEVSVIPESQTSPSVVKLQETPSPGISSPATRRRITSPISKVTHISDTERSMVAVSQNISPGLISSRAEQIVFDDSASSRVNQSAASAADEKCSYRENTLRGFGSKVDDKETEVRKNSGINDEKWSSTRNNGSFFERTKDASCIDQTVEENTRRVEDFADVKSKGTSSGVGWMSKKSFRVRKEKLDINQNGSTNDGRGFEDMNGANPRNDHSEKDQKDSESTVVKKEENIDFPSDLMCVEHIELVVAKIFRPKLQPSETKHSTRLKNMKKFRKKNCASSEGLPRMIGGTDLVVFTSTTGVEDGWVSEIQAMNQQDEEDREAEKLFRYEPLTKRKRR